MWSGSGEKWQPPLLYSVSTGSFDAFGTIHSVVHQIPGSQDTGDTPSSPSSPKGPRDTEQLLWPLSQLLSHNAQFLPFPVPVTGHKSATPPRATTQLRAMTVCLSSHSVDPDLCLHYLLLQKQEGELSILLALTRLTLPWTDGGSTLHHGTFECSTTRHKDARRAACMALHRLQCQQGKAMAENDEQTAQDPQLEEKSNSRRLQGRQNEDGRREGHTRGHPLMSRSTGRRRAWDRPVAGPEFNSTEPSERS